MCSANDLLVKFIRFLTPQGVEPLVENYEVAAESSTKRVFMFLQIGTMCTCIETRNDALNKNFVK